MSYGLGHSAPRRTKSKNIHTSATPHATSSLPPTSSWPADWPCGWLLAGFWLRTHTPRHAHDSHALPALAHRERWHHHTHPRLTLWRAGRGTGAGAAPHGSSSLVRSLARSPLVACCSSLDRFAPSIQVVGIRRNSFSVISCFPLLRRWLAGWLAGWPAGRQTKNQRAQVGGIFERTDHLSLLPYTMHSYGTCPAHVLAEGSAV